MKTQRHKIIIQKKKYQKTQCKYFFWPLCQKENQAASLQQGLMKFTEPAGDEDDEAEVV